MSGGGKNGRSIHINLWFDRCAYAKGGLTVGAGAYIFLRADLGFEPDEKLTLCHLAAHVGVAQYRALMEGYTAILK
jgi:hypothetical protein